MYLVRASQRTRRDEIDPTKRRSVLTIRATRCDATRATRSGQNGLGCQDSWRGINGASVELRTTQAVRFGSVRFCSGRLGLQDEWRLTHLANPCNTRHVFSAYLIENGIRREWSDESDDQSSRQERRDMTRQELSLVVKKFPYGPRIRTSQLAGAAMIVSMFHR